jgi:hypothetical protein
MLYKLMLKTIWKFIKKQGKISKLNIILQRGLEIAELKKEDMPLI